jgi:hypothetical protein
MFLIIVLLCQLNLLEKLHNCSLRYARILIFVLSIEFSLMASFHGESFTTASLTISKNGCVVALHDLIN